MATKFSNGEARFFNQLLNGADFETIFNEAVTIIDETKYYCNDEQAQEYKDGEKNGLLEVKAFFNKIKFFEKPETYRVNGWGYDQTNYENLKVLGQAGGCMVCIIDNNFSDVYTVQRKKYTGKAEWTKLDSSGVRTTDWRQPFTSEEIKENSYYNAYHGH